jgi:hypothetical protein
MDFRTTTVAQLAQDVSAKRISARELVGAALARIEEVDNKVNAFVAVDEERALADAAAIDARVAAGEDVGPLAGVPVGVKDLEDAAGFRTTQGSAVYADSPVMQADSPLVERLKAATRPTRSTRCSVPPPTRGTSRAPRAGPRAVPRRPSPPAWCRSAPAPTAGARSASRPRCAASRG